MPATQFHKMCHYLASG